jgi:2-phosphosulfolactate phosphatase
MTRVRNHQAVGPASIRTPEELHEGRLGTGDVVVVIDVIRAFTTAAILLSRGVPSIDCVADVEAAFRLEEPPAPRPLHVGEEVHRPTAVVDLPNSPHAALAADVAGVPAILYTANGTRALLSTPAGATVMAAALVNATATVRWLRAQRPGDAVHLAVTDDGGPEDRACAGYIAALLRGDPIDLASVTAEVRAGEEAHARRWRAFVTDDHWRSFTADVAMCAQVDTFPVAIVGHHDVRDRYVRLEPARTGARR